MMWKKIIKLHISVTVAGGKEIFLLIWDHIINYGERCLDAKGDSENMQWVESHLSWIILPKTTFPPPLPPSWA